MESYDIIFFNCGSDGQWWVNNRAGVTENIRNYVTRGGSVYASDLEYVFIEEAFPNKIDFFGEDPNYMVSAVGSEGNVQAHIHDDAMQSILSASSANIHYDLPGWIVIENVASDVEVLVAGDIHYYISPYSTATNIIGNAPLSVRYEEGEGRVIYTTFHNEHQATTLSMHALLQEMIFSL